MNKKVGESDEDEDEEPVSSPSDEKVDYPKCEGVNAHICSYEGEQLGMNIFPLYYRGSRQSKTTCVYVLEGMQFKIVLIPTFCQVARRADIER
jgi:hypothetical protein